MWKMRLGGSDAGLKPSAYIRRVHKVWLTWWREGSIFLARVNAYFALLTGGCQRIRRSDPCSVLPDDISYNRPP
jgi:hypothetical protein